MPRIQVDVVKEIHTRFVISAATLEAAEEIALAEAEFELLNDAVIESYGADDDYFVEFSEFVAAEEEKS